MRSGNRRAISKVVMAKTSAYTHRLDADLRSQSEALFNAMGMSLGTAIDVFLSKAVRVGGFPFDINLETPNRETMAAMLEAEKVAKDPKVKSYNVKEAFEELDK